jgi:hypothetical protein
MKINEILTEEEILAAPMNEMANLYPVETGLPVVIWFGEVGGQHGPRVKVSNAPGRFDSMNCFVMSVSKNPSIYTPNSVRLSADKVQDVMDWIMLNYTDLMELWKIHETGNGNAQQVLARLQKI